MIYDVGGLYVVFNSTIYPSTLQHIPEMVRWAQRSPLNAPHKFYFPIGF